MWHGCTHIAGKYPDRSGTGDFIQYGASLIKALNFTTIKLELSSAYATKYPGQSWSGTPTSLVQLAQQPGFAAVLSDAWWQRVFFNTWAFGNNSVNNPWGGSWPATTPAQEKQEVYDLAVHLLSTYSGKTFVIQSWEGDYQLMSSFDRKTPVKLGVLGAYRDWQRARIEAVQEARAAVPGSTSQVLYCIEASAVLDDWGRRIVPDVIGNGQLPDMVGFSAYEASASWTLGVSQAQLHANILANLTKMVGKVRAVMPNVPIVITEYGWPTAIAAFASLGYDIAALWLSFITSADSLGIIGSIPWEVFDNEEQSPGVPQGFYMYLRNGSSNVAGALSSTGLFWQSYL